MDIGYLFTSFDGRINRAKYWIGALILIAAWIVIALALGFLGLSIMGGGFAILVLIVQLAMLYPTAALMAKRFQDRNRPGWFAAILLVPVVLQGITNALGLTGNPLNQNALDYLFMAIMFIVGIWTFIELGCLRGTVGPNQYGPDPLGGDAAGAAARPR